ncbi:MAG TPA: 5-(carboxyamino)imidazole ribonucleotide mutase [Candidatus Dormibacteraeota bacterium]|jgi:phosphoribosylaminoimidazole carboxylase PurE protein|nr:5-(carboxyamino)imidazole ribonucleotide mutase [Candidatus Dormibacteraeota bacterium]
MSARVAIVMGSANDRPVMEKAVEVLTRLGVESDVRVLSAHRTPDALREYVQGLEARGVAVVIAGAGGAAHLAGAVAAHTTLPVIGVPLASSSLNGLDALLSTVQMPRGVPVATVAIGEAGAANAGLLAAQMLAIADDDVRAKVKAERKAQAQKILAADGG